MFNNINFVSEFCSRKQFPYKNENCLLVCSDNFLDSYRHNVYSNYMGTCLVIRQSGDIEMNPGPKPNPCHSFSIRHWNLNSLTAHNYLKVSLLGAYVAIVILDVVCLSETYLDSSNLFDDDNFNLPGYDIVRADHPSNTKRWCLYHFEKPSSFKGS